MNRWWAILLIPPLVLAQGTAPTPPVTPEITLSLPRSTSAESIQINYGFRHGNGFSGSLVRTRAGVHDYPLRADHVELGPPVSLQVLVQIPGHRVVAAEFAREDLQSGKVFTPPLVPLPTTPLNGRLIDSAGSPIANEAIHITYALSELCDWYGLVDCMVGFTPIAATRTDGNGDFAIALPALLEDPFFQVTRTPGFFRISTGAHPVDRESTLIPGSFALQNAYEPITIRKIRNGTVAGFIGTESLPDDVQELKNLTVHARTQESILAPTPTISANEMQSSQRSRLHYVPDRPTSFTGSLKPDGTFELQALPGKYDLHLWISEQSRFIPIRRDVVVQEGARVNVVAP